MNNRERYELTKDFLPSFRKTEKEHLTDLVNILIKGLYIPVEGHTSVTRRDPIRCEAFGICEEPINWGDLWCSEVKKFEDGTFLVTIEEAMPANCQTLCDYIERFMRSYGWEVRVQTEW
jgi:hypothetical protein